MSRVYFHGRETTSELHGSERAYAGVLSSDIALQVLDLSGGSRGDADPSPIKRLLVNSRYEPPKWDHTWMRTMLSGFGEMKLRFDGEEHNAFDLVLNTVIATGSPYLAFLVRMHGTCEIHGYVEEVNREWLADIFEEGRARNIFRADQGWEDVITHLRNGDGGPVVMSYSVTDGFPHPPLDWADSAWPSDRPKPQPTDPYGSGKEVREAYAALSDDERAKIEKRREEWYEFSDDEKWDMGMAELRHEDRKYLEIAPDNLTTQMFMTKKTLWDAVASPEYRQWYTDRNAATEARIRSRVL